MSLQCTHQINGLLASGYSKQFKQFCEFSGVACWPIRITSKLIEAVIPIRLQAFLVFFFDPETVICIFEINDAIKKPGVIMDMTV